jgi:myo-inositol-1-phosphate synthase
MSRFLRDPPLIEATEGKLAVLVPGLGAVGTTFIAGCLLAREKAAKPVGSLTQMATIRLGRRDEDRRPRIKDFVPLAELDDLVFGGWDIFSDDAATAARKAAVLRPEHLEAVADDLAAIHPMKAVFFPEYVTRLNGSHVKQAATKAELAEMLREDIRRFMKDNGCSRAVMIWCASTEAWMEEGPAHASLEAFEAGLAANAQEIAPSQIYAYAALKERVPYANGAPNLSLETPALRDLAEREQVAVAGKDFKTGQTMMKTILAPGFKARMLGVHGWFSTNILGNRDGEVLDDPANFKSKEKSKLGVLDTILEPSSYPDLYGDICHKVRINYYPPRGDNKEGWDNIDIFGWLGYPMQVKIDFLCRDSILAAPIVLDLALFLDLARRAGMYGEQEWLSFYFKSPMAKTGLYPEHDLFIQLAKLKNTLRYLKGEELITHLGLDYYEED